MAQTMGWTTSTPAMMVVFVAVYGWRYFMDQRKTVGTVFYGDVRAGVGTLGRVVSYFRCGAVRRWAEIDRGCSRVLARDVMSVSTLQFWLAHLWFPRARHRRRRARRSARRWFLRFDRAFQPSTSTRARPLPPTARPCDSGGTSLQESDGCTPVDHRCGKKRSGLGTRRSR